MPVNKSDWSELMRQKKLGSIATLILSGLLCIVLNSCLGGADSKDSSLRTFYATDFTDYSNYAVKAEIVYTGTHCIVYKDSRDIYMSDSDAMDMGKEFDDNIYSIMVDTFGEPCDEDGNGKIILLILDILDGGSLTSYVAGYFDPVNEFSNTYAQSKYSNQCDMLYMDSNPGASYQSVFKETMAHEFQHLIDFNQKVFIQDSSTGFDTWIDEGLSSAAERIYKGAQIQDKIDYFNDDPYHDMALGQRFIAWDKGNYNSVLGNYASVYLFFQWLNIQSANDNSIYKTIINSNHDDYQAVFSANGQMPDFSGTSFPELLRDWNIANMLNQSSGLYGYKGIITGLTVHYFNDSSDNPSYTAGARVNMQPGECVYVKITDGDTFTLSNSTTNTNAAGVNTSTKAVDEEGTIISYNSVYTTYRYSGDVLLFYNTVSTDTVAYSPTGILSSVTVFAGSAKSVKSMNTVTKRFPVDKVLRLDGINLLKQGR